MLDILTLIYPFEFQHNIVYHVMSRRSFLTSRQISLWLNMGNYRNQLKSTDCSQMETEELVYFLHLNMKCQPYCLDRQVGSRLRPLQWMFGSKAAKNIAFHEKESFQNWYNFHEESCEVTISIYLNFGGRGLRGYFALPLPPPTPFGSNLLTPLSLENFDESVEIFLSNITSLISICQTERLRTLSRSHCLERHAKNVS